MSITLDDDQIDSAMLVHLLSLEDSVNFIHNAA